MKNVYRVIVRTSPKDAPYDFEITAALIMANYFKTDVVFLRPISLKSPDLKVKNEIWELKSPRGDSKNLQQEETEKMQVKNNYKERRSC